MPLVAVILDAARPYDRLIIAGVARFARERTRWSLYVEEDPLQKLPDLARWHGQGIIANFDDRRVARAIRGLGIPVVGVGGGYGWHGSASGMPDFDTDSAAIGRLGAEHLLACGFETFAFCGYPRTTTSGWSEERAAAFAAVCTKAGRPCHTFTGRHGNARRWADLQGELARWLTQLPKPLGLMACNDLRARHVLEACRTLGLRVPHDVAVIGVDNDEMICDLTDPPLSSIDPAARRIGYEAAALLDRLMHARPEPAGRGRGGKTRRPPAAPERIVVPPIGVVARASTDTLATSDPAVVETLHALRRTPWMRPAVEALAAAVGLSRTGLETRFKAAVGRSIHEEYIRVRLAGTRRLITGSDLPLKSVAARTGFPSVQYMTTFVRRHTGLTPARLRALEKRG
ncbi:MAG: XylR family transcriptional regulator [Planctomycetia bacterium]